MRKQRQVLLTFWPFKKYHKPAWCPLANVRLRVHHYLRETNNMVKLLSSDDVARESGLGDIMGGTKITQVETHLVTDCAGMYL